MPASKGLSERARELGVSRQAVLQAERAEKGRCRDCGKKAAKNRTRCKTCLKVRADRMREQRAASGKASK